jgi:hypothetical protein
MAQHSAQAAVGGVFQPFRSAGGYFFVLDFYSYQLATFMSRARRRTLYVIIVAQTLFRSDSPGRDMRYSVRGGMYARLDRNS